MLARIDAVDSAQRAAILEDERDAGLVADLTQQRLEVLELRSGQHRQCVTGRRVLRTRRRMRASREQQCDNDGDGAGEFHGVISSLTSQLFGTSCTTLPGEAAVDSSPT